MLFIIVRIFESMTILSIIKSVINRRNQLDESYEFVLKYTLLWVVNQTLKYNYMYSIVISFYINVFCDIFNLSALVVYVERFTIKYLS